MTHYRSRMARGERDVMPMSPKQTLGRSDEIGLMVRRLRERDGIRQPVLAARARMAQATLSKIECGRRHPSQASLEKIARGLGLKHGDRQALLDAAGYAWWSA